MLSLITKVVSMRKMMLPFIVFLALFIVISSPGHTVEVALTELPSSSASVSIIAPHSSVDAGQMIVPEIPVMEAKIEVNIAARQMRVFYKNEQVFEFPVAVGATGFKTPAGKREMKQIVWNPWWLPPDSPWAKDEKPVPPGPNNPLGPVKMDLGNAILFHGTNKPQSVGRAASHGCMRMKNEDAKTLAWWVQSHFTDKTDAALTDLYASKKGRSFYVPLKMPIPVEIKYELFEKKNEQVVIHPDVYGRVANKKAKLKEWLVLQGTNESMINESQIALFLGQVKKDSIPVLLSELTQSNLQAQLPSDNAEESGAATTESVKNNQQIVF